MLALVFLVAAALMGTAILRLARAFALTRFEEVFAGIVVGWMTATALTYVVARVALGITWELMLLVTAALCIVAAIGWWIAVKRPSLRPGGTSSAASAEHRWIAALLILFLPVYAALFSTRMLPERADGIYSGGTSYYDMAFHMAITTSFLYGRNFPPVYTPLPPEPALYPFLPDFFTAVLVTGGLGFQAALCASGISLAATVTVMLYGFARRMVDVSGSDARSLAAAAVAAALFLLNGGFAFVYFLKGFPASGFRFDYANVASYDIQWTNVIVDTLLPQRGSLFGISIALLVFSIFTTTWRGWFNGEVSPWAGWKALVTAGTVTGLLPLFHAHSYLAIAIVSGFLFLLYPRRAWFAFWVPAALLALPHLISLVQHGSAEGNMRVHPLWLGHSESNWLVVWLKNAGLPAILIIPAWLSAPSCWRRFYLAFVGLLAVALVVVFSPNDTDNLKLLHYWYAATCALIGQWLVRIATEQRQRALAAFLTVGCIASGLVALGSEYGKTSLMFARAEIAAAEFVRAKTLPDAVFLTAPTFHQPVVSLAGRSALRANTMWPWSHGYEFRAREADVRRIYAGTPDALALLAYYAVDYVYLGNLERADLRANEAEFDAQLPLIYSAGGIKIYDARRTGHSAGSRGHWPAARELSTRVGIDPYAMLEEFPKIGYFLYQLSVASSGRAPRFEEFASSLRTIGQGVYVGAPGWEEALQHNKNALLHGRGADLTASSRRGAYARAWLLTHYFAYLRRDPDDAPDGSMSGYNFWLKHLERTGDYRSISRAFLESTEYRSRAISAP